MLLVRMYCTIVKFNLEILNLCISASIALLYVNFVSWDKAN
jgi:hypothetical protein